MLTDTIQPKLLQFSDTEMQQLVLDLIKRLTFKVTAYQRLFDAAPTNVISRFLARALRDEKDDLANFQSGYEKHYGPIPDFAAEPFSAASYADAVLSLLEEEMNSIAFTQRIMMNIDEENPWFDTFHYSLITDLQNEDLLGIIYIMEKLQNQGINL